jgi:hypothetical protein
MCLPQLRGEVARVRGEMLSRRRWRYPKKIRELRPNLESIAKNEGTTPSCDPKSILQMTKPGLRPGL